MSIEIKNVTKNFGKVKALDGVTFNIEEETIYGLLGRNGAGKSTLLNIISNRLFATDGEVLIDGETSVENDKAQSKVFLMTEVDAYPSAMKCRDILRWTKEFYPETDLEKGKELAEKFSLDLKKSIGSLSTGYRTIIKFIAAIISNAKYTFLDEPVLGLDANHRELLYKTILEQYSEKPRTIVISTHIIEEVSNLLEIIVIIDEGRVIENNSVESLLSRGYSVSGKAQDVDEFVKGKNVIGADVLGAVKIAYILGDEKVDSLPDGLEISPINLQKLFVELTGEEK
ncbi:MAG: ABC transporter ATP-binding protein [Clostridiales bacterium]|nr:ABC transporter ATP-binding protein [Clostridiales bacterium]